MLRFELGRAPRKERQDLCAALPKFVTDDESHKETSIAHDTQDKWVL